MIILAIIGTRTEEQSLRTDVRIGSSSHRLLVREFRRRETFDSEAGSELGEKNERQENCVRCEALVWCHRKTQM